MLKNRYNNYFIIVDKSVISIQTHLTVTDTTPQVFSTKIHEVSLVIAVRNKQKNSSLNVIRPPILSQRIIFSAYKDCILGSTMKPLSASSKVNKQKIYIETKKQSFS